MPSLKLTVLAVAAALVSAVRADYYISPDSVSLTLRKYWCSNEISTCPLICDQTAPYTTLTNTCDPETLTYGCVCGNNLQPNVSEYSLTLPYFVCEEWGNQCVTACGSDNECSSDCRENHPCGALNPTRVNSSSSASGAAATASSTSTGADTIYTGLGTSGGSSSSGSTKSSAAGRIELTQAVMSVGLTLGGLAAGLALAL